MAAILEVEGLSKTFDNVKAVRDFAFKASPGEIWGLVGPNGAGKTTALRCIASIMRPDAGRVRICGHDMVVESLAARRELGFVPEVPNPYDNLTPWDHMEFIGRAYMVNDWRPLAEKLLADFDMEEKRNELASKLSKGMRQKILIMCAFLHVPRVLLLDEPLIGIDPKGARALKDRIRQQAASGGCSVVSSHILSLVEEVCTKVAVMVKGQIIAQGTIEELRRSASLKGDATLEDAFLAVTSRAGEK